MDAAYTNFKKTALFLTIALLLAVPFAAQAQPAFVFPGGATATVNGNQPGSTQVNGSADGTTPISFNVSQVQVSGGATLSITPTSATTPATIFFSISNPGLISGVQTITVNLTPTTSGVAAAQITVTFNPNGTGGGGGNGGTSSSGGLTSSASSLSMTSANGAQASSSFNLTNTTSSAITVSGIGISYGTGQPSGWLSLSSASGTVPAGQFSVVTVYGNPLGLANTTYNATLTVTFNGGPITIPVTFVVSSNTSGGNGTLTANPNPVNWNYSTTSGVGLTSQIPNQNITISSSTGAATYSYTVQPTGANGYLLLANNGTSGTFSINTPLTISPQFAITGLSTGTYQETIQLTDSNNNTAIITVNISVNGASTGTNITLSPAPLTINAASGQTSLAQATVTITSNLTGNVTLTVSGTGLTLANSSTSQTIGVSAGVANSFIVYANPTGLASNTYIGSVSAVEGSLSQTDQVNFVVGQGSGTTTTGGVAPTSLQFAYQLGQPAAGAASSLVQQPITDSVSGSFTTNVTSGNSWLTVSPTSGTGPTNIYASVGNVASMSAGSYNGSFTVTTPAGTQTVSVTLLISSSAVVFSNPAVLNIAYTAGNPNPTTTFQVLSSDGSNIGVSAGSSQSWLSVQQLGSNTTPTSYLLTINGASLANGLNVANVSLSSGAADSTLTVPIVVSVTGSTNTGGSLTLGTSSLTFTGQVNGSAPATQTLSVAASTSTPYTAGVSIQNGNTNWLSISPSGSLNTATTSSISVSVNQSGLAVGNYTGSVNLVTNTGTQSVSVTLVVSANGTGGSVTASPSSLSFNYQTGGTVPGSQGFNVSATGGGNLNFTVVPTTQSGGNWLSTNLTTSTTPAALSVSVSPTGLQPGTYTGSITLTPNGGTATSVPVTLVVQGVPTISASPATLNLSYQAGSTNTPTATIQVGGSAANLSFTANASSSGWLSVSPTSGNTGSSGTALNVTVNPAGLSAGSYSGTIVVSGTSGAGGSSTTTVTLTVTAPLPTISAVQNAASGSGGPVSPGEIVSIFAPPSNPIGPGTPAFLTLDSNGNVSTTLGNVQVVFNGIPAPLTYVSSTQINAVVPYGIAGLFAPYVQVKYLGQSSNAFNLTTTSTAPGIFTQNGSGTGPGAILNQDFSTNGSSGATRPAAKGSVIQVYMTGEGATSPTGITGKVNCPSGQACSISQLPVPLLPVTVTLIDSTGARYPANFIFAGEAPGFVSGLMQVNVVVPPNVPSGTLQIIVSVGGNSSQSGVTVAVQ